MYAKIKMIMISFIIGAPTRLTLNKYGDKDSVCMLLDQVPHNENGTMNIGPKCWVSIVSFSGRVGNVSYISNAKFT